GAVNMKKNRDVPAGGIDHQPGNREWADAHDPALDQDFILLLQGLDAANPAANDHPAAVGIFFRKINVGIFNRADRSSDAEFPEAIQALGLPRIDAVRGDVEIRAFATEADGILAVVP